MHVRNRAFNARTFFDNPCGPCGAPTPSTSPPCGRHPPYQRNNFGGAFGGPIQKDKTFFWGVYEGLRQVKGNPVIAKRIPAACVANGTRTVAQGNPNGSSYTVERERRPLLHEGKTRAESWLPGQPDSD